VDEGEDLVLEAGAPPAAEVLERLARRKPGIVALLQPVCRAEPVGARLPVLRLSPWRRRRPGPGLVVWASISVNPSERRWNGYLVG
jgi:hypothetical protein